MRQTFARTIRGVCEVKRLFGTASCTECKYPLDTWDCKMRRKIEIREEQRKGKIRLEEKIQQKQIQLRKMMQERIQEQLDTAFEKKLEAYLSNKKE